MRLTNAQTPRLSPLFAILAGLFFALSSHGAGTGLTGDYYTANNFTGTKTSRTDATVDFDWGAGSPGFGGLGTNNFSVRWSGQLEPRYSETYTFYVTADDGARLWVNDRPVAVRTFSSAASAVLAGQIALTAGEHVNVRVEFIETTGNARVRFEWASASQAREVVPQSQLYPTTITPELGGILKEHWFGLAGTAISTLTTFSNYPAKPDGREFLLSFECLATNWADDFGTRVSGFLVPATNGNYTFAVAAADTAELWLSTDTNPANRQLIATVTNTTTFHDWTNQTNQISVPKTLSGGGKYFVELLHKAATGNDHWSVAWRAASNAPFAVIEAAFLVPNGLDRAIPAQTNFLDTLAQSHPRLFASAERFAWLKQQVSNNPAGQPAKWFTQLYNSTTNILTNSLIVFAPDNRGTILTEVRSELDRISKLGLVWRITGDTNFAARAWMELTNAGALSNWNSSVHFLDTAEMTHTFALGYDWLYDYWSATQRTFLRTNLETKGLAPGFTQFSNSVSWSKPTGNNWNLVCNGGLTMGALTLGADSETMVEQMLKIGTTNVAWVMQHFTTDNGLWYEGPGYWDYSTDYNFRHLAALESALGSDFGLSKIPNVADSGLFAMLTTSAGKRSFNFADSGAGNTRGPQMFWYARRYLRPEYSRYQRTNAAPEALDALLFDSRGGDPAEEKIQPDFYFRGPTGTTIHLPQEVGVFRSGWNDTRETWLGFKGGEMGAPHGDLDAGSFVLETAGKRWAQDLGSDDYALPGYFSETPAPGVDRWDYYRLRAEGNNCLVINPGAGPDTKLDQVAPTLIFQSETNGGRSVAVLDLTPVQSNSVTRAWRGFQLFNGRKDVLVQDEIVASSPATAWWFMHVQTNTTAVAIDPDGSAVTLTQGVERLWLKILTTNGTFSLSNAVPLPTSPNPAGQNANSNYAKLAIKLTGVTNTTLAVWMKPLAATDALPASNSYPTLIPLANWTTSGNETPFANPGNSAGNEDNFIDVDLWNYVADAETSLAALRFAVFGASNGIVTLLADGHTARFMPATNYFGPANFSFTVTDQFPDSRLLFHYDFEPPDLSSPTNVQDRSINARDGTLEAINAGSFGFTNDTPAALGGLSTRALGLFENGSNVVRLTRLVSSNEFNFSSNDWTFATWVKRVATSNDDFILHLGDSAGFGPNNSLSFYFPSGATQLSLRHYTNTGATDVSVLLNGFATNQWRHLALVRDDTNLLLYVDGALAVTTNGFNFAINQALPVQIGGHASTNFQNQRYLNGYLDDTAIFTAALSASEIAALAGGQNIASLGGASATNVVTLNLTPVNDAPLAGPLATSTPQGQLIDVDLRPLASDVETASSNLLFRVTNAVNGTVTLLPDGHTARFTASNTFSGTASFTYVATDTGALPMPFLNYSFEPPDVITDNLVTDNSGNNRNGTLANLFAGALSYTNDAPAALAPEATSISLIQSSTNSGSKITRAIATNEFNPNDSDWTFSGWFKRGSTSDEDFIFYLGTADGFGPNNELHLQGVSGTSNLRLNHYYTTNTFDLNLTVTNGATTGGWHHVAVVFNRTDTNTGDISVYLDGALGGTANGFTNGMPRPMSAVFGGHTSSSQGLITRYFNGQLDDLVLFTNALSADNVALLAVAPMSQFATRSATNIVTISVTNSPPALAGISNRVIAAGQTLLVTNSATDPQAPPQVLTFTLLSVLTNATLTTNTGVFTWRAPVAYANTTNTVQLKVSDNGSPNLGATQSFQIAVLPLATPAVVPTNAPSNRVQLTISGDAGPDYTVQATTNFNGWTNIYFTNSPALPFNWTDTNASNFLKRFYRILLGP